MDTFSTYNQGKKTSKESNIIQTESSNLQILIGQVQVTWKLKKSKK